MTKKKQKSWRDVLPVHPAADLFPKLDEEKLRELGEDIKRNGLKQPVIVWKEVMGSAFDGDDVAPEKRQSYLLDGRNRLDAMELVGMSTVNPEGDYIAGGLKKSVSAVGFGYSVFGLGTDQVDSKPKLTPGEVPDPAAYVISTNIRRRHLTPKQQVSLIVKVVKAANDFANVARSFSPTPGAKGGSTKDPLKLEVVEKAAEYGHSERTAERALAEERAATTDKPKRTFVTCSDCSARVADLDKHLKIKHKVKARRRGPPALETERMLEKAVMNTKEATARCARYDVLANKASLKKMLRLYDELEESISLGRDRINNCPPDKEIRRALSGGTSIKKLGP